MSAVFKSQKTIRSLPSPYPTLLNRGGRWTWSPDFNIMKSGWSPDFELEVRGLRVPLLLKIDDVFSEWPIATPKTFTMSLISFAFWSHRLINSHLHEASVASWNEGANSRHSLLTSISTSSQNNENICEHLSMKIKWSCRMLIIWHEEVMNRQSSSEAWDE